jgi:hypothetical protein
MKNSVKRLVEEILALEINTGDFGNSLIWLYKNVKTAGEKIRGENVSYGERILAMAKMYKHVKECFTSVVEPYVELSEKELREYAPVFVEVEKAIIHLEKNEIIEDPKQLSSISGIFRRGIVEPMAKEFRIVKKSLKLVTMNMLSRSDDGLYSLRGKSIGNIPEGIEYVDVPEFHGRIYADEQNQYHIWNEHGWVNKEDEPIELIEFWNDYLVTQERYIIEREDEYPMTVLVARVCKNGIGTWINCSNDNSIKYQSLRDPRCCASIVISENGLSFFKSPGAWEPYSIMDENGNYQVLELAYS